MEVYYRDYHNVDGLQIPFVLETRVVPVANPDAHVAETSYAPEKIVITKAMVNPPLPDALFAKLRPTDGAAPPGQGAVARPVSASH